MGIEHDTFFSESERLPQNQVCSEFKRLLDEAEIPVGFELKNYLEEPERVQGSGRYGNPFALVSGAVMRTVAKHGIGSPDVYRDLFGIDPYGAEDDIEDFIRSSQPDLPSEQTKELVLKELAEVIVDPRVFYGLDALRQQPDHDHQSVRMLWNLLSQSVYEEQPNEMLEFDCSQKGRTWGNCKDSEFYLSCTLRGKRRDYNDARAVVYVDEHNQPLIYQKAGGYHIQDQAEFSNATAVNMQPLIINGLVVPPGTLLGVEQSMFKPDAVTQDMVLAVSSIESLLPLRLTVFAVDGSAQAKTFGKQYEDFSQATQTEMGYIPGLADFRAMAEEIVQFQKRNT